MHSYVLAAAAVFLLGGFILGVAARSYRTAEFRAAPWYKSFRPIWQSQSLYTPPGPMLVHLSSSLTGTGAVLLIVGLLLK